LITLSTWLAFLRPNLFFQGLLAFAGTIAADGRFFAPIGDAITFVDVPPGAFAESLQGILPPWQIQGLLEDYAHYRRGEAASVSPAVAEITGRPRCRPRGDLASIWRCRGCAADRCRVRL
jgi:uncharacterized protein YbjT (DUF2867 family)